ncbi:alkaline phosphatase D family protein [Caenimonas terrae]|uniref:Cholesterol oxidase n=1 Tax=Caenimonas terrae TaxID=696074 RepID=A0ABW0NAZ4_9BURK
MPRLSEHVEFLVERELLDDDGKPKLHAAVVVGSGYGGAVSALRLAQAQVEVLVLERGKEYQPGDFPNDIGEAFGHIRLDREHADNVNGYESGLYDMRWGDGIGALVGNALGGTSQINANVVLQPDPRVFAKQHAGRPAWPKELAAPAGGGVVPDLAAAYKLAHDTLDPEVFRDETLLDPARDANPASFVRPLKRIRLKELSESVQDVANGARVSFQGADITVNLGRDGLLPGIASEPCRGCGECVSGCNWNSKKTLTASYLPQAKLAGARMFTGVSVLSVERCVDPGEDRTLDHWIVHFVRTETRKLQRDGVNVPVHQLHARHVVLSAGTFGSTEILLRSGKKWELALPDAIGERLSTNGDSLAFGYLLKDRVNGSGIGSGAGSSGGFAVGPTITAMIRVDHPDDVTQSMLIEDGAIPSLLGGIFHELVTTSATLAQLDNHHFRDLPAPGQPTEQATDWAVLQPRGRDHTLTLLGMGHDPSAGTLTLGGTDRLSMKYPTKESQAVATLHTRYLHQVEQLGAIYLANPVLEPLPPGVSKVLSSPPMDNGTLTVHPLGGCCMGDDGSAGVVNHLGQVFSGNGTELHEGLYVLDGSIVPTSLGANPLFTITALAERAMVKLVPLIAQTSRSSRAAAPLQPEPYTGIPLLNPYAREVNVNFTEAMRATGGALRWRNEDCDAHLLLQMPISDLELFGTDGRHLIVIPNQLGAARGDKEQLQPHMSIDRYQPSQTAAPADKVRARLLVESGWVSILPVPVRRRFAWDFAWLRTALTWWIDRGRDEVLQAAQQALQRFGQMLRRRKPVPDPSQVGFLERLSSLIKLARHASENRTMEYHLRLRDAEPLNGGSIGSYTLHGTKRVGYAASWGAIGRYFLHITRPLDRVNVWKAFGLLQVVIRDEDGQVAGSGALELDMLDMTRMHAPQLGPQRDTPNALLGLAGYPMWFARLMMKTRLWDFRLPDYPGFVPDELIPAVQPRPVPVPPNTKETDTPWPDFPPLRLLDGRKIPPCPSEELPVRRRKARPGDALLKLTRYRQPQIEHATTVDGLVQAKVMLLLNGFAQSTLGFVPQEHVRKRNGDGPARDDEPGLAEFFYEQGYDVWLFDYRTSAILDESKQPCTMDEIAQFDIPAAVDRARATVAGELNLDPQRVRIFAFAHCVGAASMAMSLLGGSLQDRLAGVTFSQMQAFLIGSRTAQMRLRVGGILRDTLGIQYLRLSAAEREPTVLESVLDRLFASLPVDPGEYCPHEHNRLTPRPAICTCKRMSGTISRLLKHDRIKPQTHDRLPVYFGRANTSLLVHGGRCVDNERLVNADGQNVYVTDENITAHLNLPVAILHGAHNALFDVESAHRTHDQIRRVHPELDAAGVCTKIIAPDYGHFDCTIGYGCDMQQQILGPLRDFYARAWKHRLQDSKVVVPQRERRSVAKAPLSGPVLGWSRLEQRGDRLVRLQRLWIEVDESESLKASYVATHTIRVKPKDGPGLPDDNRAARVQLWPVQRLTLDGAILAPPDAGGPANRPPYIAIGLADLEFDATEGGDFRVFMFSVHPALIEPAVARPPQASAPAGPPPLIPEPLTPEEIEQADQDGRLPRLMSPPRDGFVPDDFIGTLPDGDGADGKTIQSKGELPAAQGRTLWRGLMQQQRKACEVAQRADPGTLSRKRRQLTLPTRQPRGVASLGQDILRAPPAGAGVVFVAACCRYPGLAFEDRRSDLSFERISRHIARTAVKPAFVMMLGDQIYADATAGLMDNPSAVEKVVMSHQRAFGTPGFVDLTSSLPTYMVMDDHEISDNWSRDLVEDTLPRGSDDAGQCSLPEMERRADAQTLFATAKAAFSAYQWAHGPRNGNVAPDGNLMKPPLLCFDAHFTSGDCPFFVLDTRTSRKRFSVPQQVCDERQLAALDLWLDRCRDQFGRDDKRPKFIVSGSVFAPGLRTAMVGEPTVAGLSDLMVDSWQMAQPQRARVLQAIIDRGVRNVVFLSGDYHCAATATIKLGDRLSAYAIVTPPFYAPLPGANLKRWQIADEDMQLPDGTLVKIDAHTSDGDGFVEIRALPLPDGRWQLELRYDQTNSASKADDDEGHSRTFVLG